MNWNPSFDWKVMIAVMAVVVGPVGMYTRSKKVAERTSIDATGLVVQGTIEGGQSTGGRRSRSYDFDVLFRRENGAAYRKTFKVGSSFFKSHTTGDGISDAIVQVHYNPADPEQAYLEGTGVGGIPIPGGIALSLAGAGALVWLVKRPKPEEQED